MKKLCALGHRMIPIVPDLLLCQCSSYGRLSYLKGAVDEARALVDKKGGIEKLRNELEIAEQLAIDTKKAERAERQLLAPKPRPYA